MLILLLLSVKHFYWLLIAIPDGYAGFVRPEAAR